MKVRGNVSIVCFHTEYPTFTVSFAQWVFILRYANITSSIPHPNQKTYTVKKWVNL